MQIQIVKTGKQQYEAVTDEGDTIALIRRYYKGSHGHAYGWEHYCFDHHRQKLVPAEMMMSIDIPCIFRSVKAFAAYYGAD